MNLMIFIDKWLTKLLEWFLVVLFFGFFAMVCILVVLRYGFGDTIIGGNEAVTIAFVFTVAIGAAVAITRREHIAITFFIDLLPIPLKKAVYIFDLLLIALINAVMIKYSIEWISMTGKAPWHPLGLPQGYFQIAIPVGCGLAIFFSFVKIVLTLAGRESVESVWMPEG